jgi:adenylosuccinate lyase
MHERLRSHAMAAWDMIQQGHGNPLADLVCADDIFRQYLSENELRSLMDARHYVGSAPQRARQMAARVRAVCMADGE